MKSWNPRYVNYARVHGQSPEEMLVIDDFQFPGGKMAGFLIWNSARIEEFKQLEPKAFFMGHLTNHQAYDTWLSSIAPNPKPVTETV